VTDDNGGKCAKAGKSFSYRVPCKLSAGGSVTFDTASVADGAHELMLEVYDATGSNKSSYGPWAVVADTRAPVIADLSITGTPRAGEPLKGSATVNGQNPTVDYQWLRGATDGSDPQPIAGATTATYHLTKADVGHKVMLAVKATDAGGSAERTTKPTDPPFDGKVVAECESEQACQAAAASNAAASADATGTVPLANPIRDAGSNGAPPDGQATITARLQRGSRTTGRLVARFNERIRVSGRITTASGTPIAGARIYLAEKSPTAPETAWKATGATTSTATGAITASSARGGHTRQLRLVYFPNGGIDANRASNAVALTVRQDALLRISHRSLRNGQTLRFRGTVRGQIPRAGAPVQLQVKLRTGWFTFKRLTVGRRAHGRFAARYTFRRTTSRTRYRFRVRVLPRNSSSYATGYSVTRSVVVRP
jgi:hypothetical protein